MRQMVGLLVTCRSVEEKERRRGERRGRRRVGGEVEGEEKNRLLRTLGELLGAKRTFKQFVATIGFRVYA